jgi:hypothetical protein
MKKIYAVYILCQLLIANCFAQGFNWEWARCGKGGYGGLGGWQEGVNIACNVSAGVYITGYFTDTAIFGFDTLLYNSNECFFLARYDTAGNFRWAKSEPLMPYYSNSQGTAAATDASGNVYLTVGYAGDSFLVGNITLYSNASLGGASFVAAFDTAGDVMWAKGINGGIALAIATDAYKNIYVTGAFSADTVIFGNSVLVNSGYANIFLAKYDSAGNILWAQKAGGNSYDYGDAVATDDVGNVYLTGEISSDSMKIGDTVFYNPSLNHYILTAKFSPAGALIWVSNSGSNNTGLGPYSIATDANENVYITGVFESPSLSFGAVTLLNNPAVEGYSFFLVKYDGAGNLVWAKGATGNSGPEGYSVTTDVNNNVYVSGGLLWAGGDTTTFVYNTTTLIDTGTHDPMFILKLDPDGNVLNAQTFESGGDDVNWLCVDALGNGYLGGDFYNIDSLAFGNSVIKPQFQNFLTANEYMFVAKFDAGIKQCGLPAVSITVDGDTLTANNGVQFQWYLNNSPLPGDTNNRVVASKVGDYAVQITDSAGCTALSNAVNISAIAHLAADGLISIYPNPSVGSWQLAVGNAQLAVGGQWAVGSGQLAISNSLIGAAFEVWDNTGQIIYQSKITSAVTEINLPALANGVYFLRVNTGEGVLVRKLVKF